MRVRRSLPVSRRTAIVGLDGPPCSIRSPWGPVGRGRGQGPGEGTAGGHATGDRRPAGPGDNADVRRNSVSSVPWSCSDVRSQVGHLGDRRPIGVMHQTDVQDIGHLVGTEIAPLAARPPDDRVDRPGSAGFGPWRSRGCPGTSAWTSRPADRPRAILGGPRVAPTRRPDWLVRPEIATYTCSQFPRLLSDTREERGIASSGRDLPRNLTRYGHLTWGIPRV